MIIVFFKKKSFRIPTPNSGQVLKQRNLYAFYNVVVVHCKNRPGFEERKNVYVLIGYRCAKDMRFKLNTSVHLRKGVFCAKDPAMFQSISFPWHAAAGQSGAAQISAGQHEDRGDQGTGSLSLRGIMHVGKRLSQISLCSPHFFVCLVQIRQANLRGHFMHMH